MKDIALVIRTLKEMSGWISFSEGNRQRIDAAVERLERWPSLSEAEREKLKLLLSREGMFHVRWLGDIDVPDFPGDGTSYPWWNYLSKVADICQKNL